jgi:hypothetical protein
MAEIASGDGVETTEDMVEAMMAIGDGVGTSDETGAANMARKAGAVRIGDVIRTWESVAGGILVQILCAFFSHCVFHMCFCMHCN